MLYVNEATMSQPGCGVEELQQNRSRPRKCKILLPSSLVAMQIMVSIDMIKKQYLKKKSCGINQKMRSQSFFKYFFLPCYLFITAR